MARWPAGHGACQTDTGGYAPGKRANTGTHASTKTHSHTPLLPMQTSVIRVKRRARTTEIGALNACMWPDEHSRAREQKCGTLPELCRLMLLYVGHDA